MPRTNSSIQEAKQSSVLAMKADMKVIDTVPKTLYDFLYKKGKQRDFL